MNDEKNGLLNNLNHLISVTSHKKQRVQDILNMTKMQAEAIEQKDINLLTGYIREKQRHIDAIDELDAKFTERYEQNIKGELASGSFKKRSWEERQLYERLQAEISQVQDIISEIYQIEKDNNLKANELMEELKGKIRHIQTGKKGHNAYNRPYSYNDGIYIDQKK